MVPPAATSRWKCSGTAAMRDAPTTLPCWICRCLAWTVSQLARTIKADPALAALPLVMLTSITQLGHEELVHAGIAAYLTKPVRQSHLFDCLTLVKGMSTPAVGASSEHTTLNRPLSVGAVKGTDPAADIAG